MNKMAFYKSSLYTKYINNFLKAQLVTKHLYLKTNS